MRSLFAALLCVTACRSGSPAGPEPGKQGPGTRAEPNAPASVARGALASASASDALEPLCVHYVYKLLGGSFADSDHHHAMDDALRAYDGATDAAEIGEHRKAALGFLACARHYRAVPERHRLRSSADDNARVCYYNAMYAFANAGELSSRGSAAFERAASEDPRLASYLHELSKDPPTDCDAPGLK